MTPLNSYIFMFSSQHWFQHYAHIKPPDQTRSPSRTSFFNKNTFLFKHDRRHRLADDKHSGGVSVLDPFLSPLNWLIWTVLVGRKKKLDWGLWCPVSGDDVWHPQRRHKCPIYFSIRLVHTASPSKGPTSGRQNQYLIPLRRLRWQDRYWSGR